MKCMHAWLGSCEDSITDNSAKTLWYAVDNTHLLVTHAYIYRYTVYCLCSGAHKWCTQIVFAVYKT